MSSNFNNDAGNGFLGSDGLITSVQTVAAAGSNSQANAALINRGNVIVVTVSATTRGVKLPVAVTGMQVQVMNGGASAVKPYPNTNGKIGAASTNAAGTAIAANKGSIYVAQNTTLWRVISGA